MAGMKEDKCLAKEWQNKRSFKETLEAVCGHPVSEQEADDALYTLTEFFKLLGKIEQEQQAQKREEHHD